MWNSKFRKKNMKKNRVLRKKDHENRSGKRKRFQAVMALAIVCAVGIISAGFFLLDESQTAAASKDKTASGPGITGEGAIQKQETDDALNLFKNDRNLPIIMYHSVVKDGGQKGPYVVTVEEMENDLKWIQANGYETVLMEDLISFVNGDGDLPEKPFLVTLDDGNYNNLCYVLPLLEKYKMKAVVSAVGIYADKAEQAAEKAAADGDSQQNPVYDYLTWEEIKELNQSPLVEIQNHSYNLHDFGSRKGSSKRQGESSAEYIEMLAGDLSKMQAALAEKAEVYASTFTYPYGIISDESLDVVKALGFQASLSCYEKKNTIVKGDPDCLYILNRYNRPSGVNTDSFMKKMTKD